MDKQLFERIGGEAAVEAAVNRFYDHFIPQPEIQHFFRGIALDQQKEKLRKFFTLVLGGSNEPTMQQMIDSHKPLLKKGLLPRHFDMWLEMMEQTLNDLSIPDVFIHEFLETACQLKNEMFPNSAMDEK